MTIEQRNALGPNECSVPISQGQLLVFPDYKSSPEGCNYIRFLDPDGSEVLYYDAAEWADEPVTVMGAIMAAIQNGVEL